MKKKWYESRGVWGSLVVLACALFQFSIALAHPDQDGPQLTAPQTNVVDLLLKGGSLLGGGLALLGRAKATGPISFGSADDDLKNKTTTTPLIASLAVLALLLSGLTLTGCGTNTAELPQRQATRGDNFSQGVTVNINPLGVGRSPVAATPGLPGTPAGVNESTNQALGAAESPAKLADNLTVGNVTVSVTVETRSDGGGTLSASNAGGTSGPQTATPSTSVSVPIQTNLPGSAGAAGKP